MCLRVSFTQTHTHVRACTMEYYPAVKKKEILPVLTARMGSDRAK